MDQSGSHLFRDPDDPNRILVVFDRDEESYKEFVALPEMQEIFKEAGLQEPPTGAELVREHDA